MVRVALRLNQLWVFMIAIEVAIVPCAAQVDPLMRQRLRYFGG